jgi:hypothetical protein
MRLNFRHRRYLANYFIRDRIGSGYDVWSTRSAVLKKYSKELYELILQCMELERGEGFVDYFKRNTELFKHMWAGSTIEPGFIGLSWNTVVDHIKKEVKMPTQRFPGWELTTGNIGRYIPNINLNNNMGPVPNLAEFSKDYELVFPKSVWDSEPFREIQNIYLKLCVEYCSSPPELVDYFCGSDWDEFRLDLRTFLIPQGIKTVKDLQYEYPKYYEILISDFRRELC